MCAQLLKNLITVVSVLSRTKKITCIRHTHTSKTIGFHARLSLCCCVNVESRRTTTKAPRRPPFVFRVRAAVREFPHSHSPSSAAAGEESPTFLLPSQNVYTGTHLLTCFGFYRIELWFSSPPRLHRVNFRSFPIPC